MRKTSIYLDEEVDAGLARLARQQGITKAELIRRVLRDAATAVPRPRISAIGVAGGPGDVSTDAVRHLTETGIGER